jgi:serine/threonine protein kinase
VVHLDIKPENFVMRNQVQRVRGVCESEYSDQECRAGGSNASSHTLNKRRGYPLDLVLIDFGYSMRLPAGDLDGKSHKNALQGEWRLQNFAGSVTYAAPEVTRSRYSPASDLWSAGVILYVLLAGQPPWQTDTTMTIQSKSHIVGLARTGCDPHGLWADISAEARDLLGILLSSNPSERLSAEAALNHPWLSTGGSFLGSCGADVEKSTPIVGNALSSEMYEPPRVADEDDIACGNVVSANQPG